MVNTALMPLVNGKENQRYAKRSSDLIERIKRAIEKLPDIDLGAIVVQRAKVLIGVNAKDKSKARKTLSSPEFATSVQATITPLRKTQATGFSVQVTDPTFGKPVFIRVRSGGVLNRGISNEEGLVATIQAAIQEGLKNVVFKDSFGGCIRISNVVSVRRVGNDSGSRMGNRADIVVTDGKGVDHRFSVKKDNANGVAGLIRYMAKRRLSIQRDLREFLELNPEVGVHASGYVAVPLKNEQLFKYCWFGNDIDSNGGVLIGDFESDKSLSLDKTNTTIVLKCTKVFSINDNLNELMNNSLTGIDLLMKLKQRTSTFHLDIIGAKRKSMCMRYELPGFDIDEVTSEE